jgi:hypothetical protein
MVDMPNGGQLIPERHSSPTRPTGHRPDGAVVAPRLVARWLLLGVVIAAVFGLHVLTVDHGDHGDLPTAVLAGNSSVHTLGAAEITGLPGLAELVAAADLESPIVPSDDGGGALAGCMLFLVVAGSAVLVLLMLIRRRIGDPHESGPGGLAAGSWHPAAPAVPRFALGVIRV